jgi:hypothetical protein
MSPELHVMSDHYACDEWFEFTGSKGVLWVNGCSGRVFENEISCRILTSKGWSDVEVESTDWAFSFERSSENFVDACLGLTNASLTGVEGCEILNFAIAMQNSSSSRKEIRMLDTSRKETTTKNMTRSSTSRILSTSLGDVVGVSNKWVGGQYCSIFTESGLVGCGIYDTVRNISLCSYIHTHTHTHTK